MPPSTPLTPDVQLDFKKVSDAQISPDGSRVAFVLSNNHVTDTVNPKSNIWIVDTEGGATRRLTAGTRTDLKPRWSPDGRHLAFLSDRDDDGQMQVYLMPAGGGEPERLTDGPGPMMLHGGVPTIEWSPDGSRLAFMKCDHVDGDPIEFERLEGWMRLYVIDIASRATSAVSPNGLQVWDFGWSPDGDHFAATVSDDPFHDSWYDNRLVRFVIGGGETRTLYDTKRPASKPTWSPDGRHIAFTSSVWSDRYSVRGDVWVVPADGGAPARDVSEGHVASYSWIEWTPDGGRILVAGSERAGSCVASIDLGSGERQSLWYGDTALAEGNYPSFSSDDHGNLAIVLEDAANPRDVYLARPADGAYSLERLTTMNPGSDDVILGHTEELRWKGTDGLDIQGFLLRPPGHAGDGPLPLVCIVHGGPTSQTANVYHAASNNSHAQLFAAAGFAVLLPNPRGSVGWGLEFAESNVGDQGGMDWQDILRGVDYCVEQGIADPDRLGLTGGSFGGYITAWGVTQTDRFKAAVMYDGVCDWRSLRGISEIPAWPRFFYGHVDGWDPDGLEAEFSPITHVKNVSTPTLIIHGGEDVLCPIEQARMFHRALKDHGVKTELVVHPREPHGHKERNHIIDAWNRTIAWMTEHLKP